MSDDNRHTEQIEQYLNGELKGKEKEAFKRRLETDPDFAAEVTMHQAIIEGIADARREELRAFIKQNAKPRDVQPAYTRWVVASAAAVVFAVGLYAVFNFYSTAENDNTLAENKQKQEQPPEVFEDKATEDTTISAYGNANGLVTEEQPAAPEIAVIEDEPLFTHDLNEQQPSSAPLKERDFNQSAKQVELSLRKDEDKDGVDDKFDTEEFDENLVVEDFGMEEKIDAAPKKLAAPKSEEIKVAKDIKLYDTTIVMQQFTAPSNAFNVTSPTTLNFTNAPNLVGTYNWEFGDEADSLNKTTLKTNENKNVITLKATVADTTDKITENKDKASTKEVLPVNIQFWKSPVNYKGYSFNGKNLKLYGMDKQTKVYIYRLSGNWYMKMGDFYYTLNPDNQFHTYKRLEDTFIIKQLESEK